MWSVHNKNKNGGWLKRKYANKARTWNHCHFLVFRSLSLFSSQCCTHQLIQHDVRSLTRARCVCLSPSLVWVSLRPCSVARSLCGCVEFALCNSTYVCVWCLTHNFWLQLKYKQRENFMYPKFKQFPFYLFCLHKKFFGLIARQNLYSCWLSQEILLFGRFWNFTYHQIQKNRKKIK